MTKREPTSNWNKLLLSPKISWKKEYSTAALEKAETTDNASISMSTWDYPLEWIVYIQAERTRWSPHTRFLMKEKFLSLYYRHQVQGWKGRIKNIRIRYWKSHLSSQSSSVQSSTSLATVSLLEERNSSISTCKSGSDTTFRTCKTLRQPNHMEQGQG